MSARTTASGHRDVGGSITRVETTPAGAVAERRPLIPAADMEPTEADMARARRDLAAAESFAEARAERSAVMCQAEALAEALATGEVYAAAIRMQEMLAYERAYQERRLELRAELDAQRAARLAAAAVNGEAAR